jgi:hypothetical protein
MHLNKLSTAALMRLTILASLNLLLARIVDYWLVLHPLIFLILVTLNRGLYALMVYSGTLNKTLIAMMLAGLAGVLAVIIYAGVDASAFTDYGGPFHDLAQQIESLVNGLIAALPRSGFRAPPKPFWWQNGTQVAYMVIDVIWSFVIITAGLLARVLQATSRRRDTPAPPPLDAGTASPL